MVSEIKLKPCPFCGHTAEMFYDEYESMWSVHCYGCHGQGGRCDKEAEAAAAWNRRVEPCPSR